MPYKFTQILTLLLLSISLGHAQIIEKSYLTTDKTIYAPEDTVWFKAQVFDRTNSISDQSVALHVLVADSEGNKRVDTSWPILQGVTDGYFIAPELEGQYAISAISGQMIGSDPDLAFRKIFYVRSELVDELLISAFPQFDMLRRDVENLVDIYTRFNLDKRAPRERLRYKVLQGESVVQEGKLRTDKEGKVSLNIGEKLEVTSDLTLMIESDNKDLSRPIKLALPVPVDKKIIDLQAFPEGGRLVAGIANKIALKAIDQQGQPVDFKALLKDSSGSVVDTIKSLYAGMASFNIIPKANKVLNLEIIVPAVNNPIVQLPMPEQAGVAMSIVGEEGQRLIRLLSNQEMTGEVFRVEISQFDRLIQALESKLVPRQFFKIPWENLAPGLVKVTLFKDDIPYSERVFFNEPDAQLNIEIKTDKKIYQTREKVDLNIQVTDQNGKPVIGSFSLSAVDTIRALSPGQGQPNILASLLLTSEIKGNVPTPNFYFSGKETAIKALDLVTLTNGYRKYISSSIEDPEAITGFLLENANKRKLLKNRSVSLIDFKDLDLGEFDTDESGRFTVPSTYLKDRGDTFIISSPSIKEKDRFALVFDDTLRVTKTLYFKNLHQQLPKPVKNMVYQPSFKLKQDRFNSTILLNSVTVEGSFNFRGACELQDYHFKEPWITKRIEDLDLTNNSIMNLLMQVSRHIKGYGDGVGVYINEKNGSGPLFRYRDAILSSLQMSNTIVQPFKVYLNCQEIKDDYFFGSTQPASFKSQLTLENIDFSNLESISVFVPMSVPYPSLPKIEINTVNDVIIRTETFQKVRYVSAYKNYSRQFYSPKYDTPEKISDPVPDLRSTIFWNANVITDENGKASLSYYNADRSNPVLVTVEGVSQQSNVGTATKTYQVKERND